MFALKVEIMTRGERADYKSVCLERFQSKVPTLFVICGVEFTTNTIDSRRVKHRALPVVKVLMKSACMPEKAFSQVAS